jgi:tartrate dehydratase alpha subunit/fumarate hydratase class I-like protein
MNVDLQAVEDAAKDLYIRALKVLPPTSSTASSVCSGRRPAPRRSRCWAPWCSNIAVAEQTDNLLCQDTGIPIYNVTIGRGVQVDGMR